MAEGGGMGCLREKNKWMGEKEKEGRKEGRWSKISYGWGRVSLGPLLVFSNLAHKEPKRGVSLPNVNRKPSIVYKVRDDLVTKRSINQLFDLNLLYYITFAQVTISNVLHYI